MASQENLNDSFGESTLKKLLLIVCSWLCSIGTSGAVFGFSSLRPILKDAGVYGDLCLNQDQGADCQEQNLKLALMFTVASTTVNMASFPVGFFLDRFGPRVTMASGSVIFALGCILFSVAHQLSDDLYIFAYLLFAIGGPGVFLSTLHLSCAFPRYSNFLMTAMTSSFDISTVVFFLFNQIYFAGANEVSNGDISASSTSKRIGVSELFAIYLIVPVTAFFCALTLMPKIPYEIKDPEEIDKKPDETANTVLSDIEMSPVPDVDQQEKKLLELPFKLQIKSLYFIMLSIFMCCYMLRLNFYIGNVEGQLRYFIKDNTALTGALSTFGIILPVGPVISIFITSSLLMLPLELCYTILAMVQIVFSVMTIGFTSNVQLQKFGSFIIFVLMRSMTFSFCNNYVAKYFGFKTFGKIYGLIMLISGLFSISQYLFVYLAVTVWGGNYTNVSLIMCCFCVAAAVLLIGFLLLKKRRKNATEHMNGGSDAQNNNDDARKI